MARELVLAEADGHAVVKITCPSREVADRIADALVVRQAAACVNILEGITSVYRWQGEVCRDQETLLLVKTVMSKGDAVLAVLQELHPYDVPEAIWTRVAQGSKGYLDWMTESVG